MSDVCLTPPAQGTRDSTGYLLGIQPCSRQGDLWGSAARQPDGSPRALSPLCTAQTSAACCLGPSSGCRGWCCFYSLRKASKPVTCIQLLRAGTRNVRAMSKKVNRSNGAELSPMVGRKQAPRAPAVVLKTPYSYFLKSPKLMLLYHKMPVHFTE